MKAKINCIYYESDTEGCEMYGTPNCDKCPNYDVSEEKMKMNIAKKLPQSEAHSVLDLLFGEPK